KRTVWSIPTAPYTEAHFATFPPALVEPCLKAGTSEVGCCPTCGAPWERLTEHTEAYKKRLGKSWHDHKDDLKVGQRGCPSAFRGGASKVTIGWEATCDCPYLPPVP